MTELNLTLLNILVIYAALFVAVFVTVLGLAFGRKKWIEWVVVAQAWANNPDTINKLTSAVDEPSDVPILLGVRFLNAIGLKVTPEEVSAILPDLIESAVTGLKESEGITPHVASKLD